MIIYIGIKGEGNGNPLQYSCLQNPVDRGAWWAAVHRAAQTQTQLKQLSSSSRSYFFYLHLAGEEAEAQRV